MSRKFKSKKNGYHFIEVEATNKERPYKVCCVETGETKDSSIDYDSAVNLIVDLLIRRDEEKKRNSNSIDFVKNLFEMKLLGVKKNDCDEIVKNQIVGVICGDIISVKTERFDSEKKYLTEYFIVTILFENGWKEVSTSVMIEPRNK